jgi:hypothetical protein
MTCAEREQATSKGSLRLQWQLSPCTHIKMFFQVLATASMPALVTLGMCVSRELMTLSCYPGTTKHGPATFNNLVL